MASLFDVMDTLQGIVLAAVFPAGVSITGKPVDVGQGWPLAADADAAVAAKRSLVSIFSVPGATAVVPQFLNDPQETVVAPVHGLSATMTPDQAGFVLTGTPGAGEYVTAIVNGQAYSHAAVAGDTAASMASALAALIAANFTLVSAPAGTVSIPGVRSLVVRIGAGGTVARIIHRQRQQFRLSAWSPNPADRAKLASAIDVACKQNLEITFSDSSCGIMRYESTLLDDKYQNNGIYRCDLVFSVEYATIETHPAYEITAVSFTGSGDPSFSSAG